METDMKDQRTGGRIDGQKAGSGRKANTGNNERLGRKAKSGR